MKPSGVIRSGRNRCQPAPEVKPAKTSCAWSARAAKAALMRPIASAPSQNTNRGFQIREEVIRALERRNTLFRGARCISLAILSFSSAASVSRRGSPVAIARRLPPGGIRQPSAADAGSAERCRGNGTGCRLRLSTCADTGRSLALLRQKRKRRAVSAAICRARRILTSVECDRPRPVLRDRLPAEQMNGR